MGKEMSVGDQAFELCQEIRSAVESFWAFTAISEYMDRPQGLLARDRFMEIYLLLVNNSFDAMVVAIFNLLDRSGRVMTLKTFAAALERAGEPEEIIQHIRGVYDHHEILWKAICRVRNNGVAHLNSIQPSRSHMLEASLGVREIRSFLQDAILVFDSAAPYCTLEVGPPSRKVESQASQLFHLATAMSEHLLSAESTNSLDKLHNQMP